MACQHYFTIIVFGLSSLFYFNDLVNPRDIPVVTVCDFTKFHLPPPLPFEFEKISRISPYPGAENLIHPLYSPTYSPGWPGVLPLGVADDMCITQVVHSQYIKVAHVVRANSDEGLTLETSTLESLYGGQFTFSYQLC